MCVIQVKFTYNYQQRANTAGFSLVFTYQFYNPGPKNKIIKYKMKIEQKEWDKKRHALHTYIHTFIPGRTRIVKSKFDNLFSCHSKRFLSCGVVHLLLMLRSSSLLSLAHRTHTHTHTYIHSYYMSTLPDESVWHGIGTVAESCMPRIIYECDYFKLRCLNSSQQIPSFSFSSIGILYGKVGTHHLLGGMHIFFSPHLFSGPGNET